MGGFIVRTSGLSISDNLTSAFIARHCSLLNLLVVSKISGNILSTGILRGGITRQVESEVTKTVCEGV